MMIRLAVTFMLSSRASNTAFNVLTYSHQSRDKSTLGILKGFILCREGHTDTSFCRMRFSLYSHTRGYRGTIVRLYFSSLTRLIINCKTSLFSSSVLLLCVHTRYNPFAHPCCSYYYLLSPNILFLHILFVLHFLFYCIFYSLFLPIYMLLCCVTFI